MRWRHFLIESEQKRKLTIMKSANIGALVAHPHLKTLPLIVSTDGQSSNATLDARNESHSCSLHLTRSQRRTLHPIQTWRLALLHEWPVPRAAPYRLVACARSHIRICAVHASACLPLRTCSISHESKSGGFKTESFTFTRSENKNKKLFVFGITLKNLRI